MKRIAQWTLAVVAAWIIALVLTTAVEKRLEAQKPPTREYPLWCHNEKDISLSSVCSTNAKQRRA